MATKQINQYTAANSIDATNDYFLIDPGGTGSYKKINRNVILGVSGTPADLSTIQTFTNKVLDNTNTITLKDTLFTLQDDGDATKQVKFQLSGITTGNTRTLTVPNASVTLASLTGTETFTNKTITSPAITGGTIDNSTITVDSISGHTTASTVTVGGVQNVNGVITTSNSITNNGAVAAGAIIPNSLVASAGTGWAWQSWTPTFTNWTIGSGGSAGTTAKYVQIGKTVFYRIKTTLGNTGESVTGSISFSLPLTANAGYGIADPMSNIVRMGAAATGYMGYVYIGSSTTGTLIPLSASGSYVADSATSSSVPNTWTAGDYFVAQGFYETV